jgi:hypothetical protein
MLLDSLEKAPILAQAAAFDAYDYTAALPERSAMLYS